MKLNFSAAFAYSVLLFFGANLVAQYRESDLEKFGLVNHWEGNLGGAGTVGGANSVLIWPHSTKNHEVVRVVVSGRLVGAFLTVLDAENGTLIWRNQLPDHTLPVFGPGASDDYVVVTNGKRLLVYEMATGRTVVDRMLEFVPTGQPTIANGKAVVPSVGGRTIFYDIKDPKARSLVLRIGTENRFGIAKSADRYLAWPVDSKLVIAQTEPETRIWTMFDTRSKIHAKPVAVDSGFVAVSESGNVVRCKNSRLEPLVWQTKIGSTCKQSPVPGKNIVTVVTDNNQIFALSLEDGQEVWRSTSSTYVSVLAVTKSKVYAFDKSGNLVILDSSSGRVDGRMSVGLIVPIANTVSDRLFFAAQDGRIVSIREEDAKTPSFHFSTKGTSSDSAPEAEEKEAKPDEAAPAVDPFGNSDLPMTDATPDPFEVGKDPL